MPIRVYAEFECINQPANHREAAPKILFEQIPIAVGFHHLEISTTHTLEWIAPKASAKLRKTP